MTWSHDKELSLRFGENKAMQEDDLLHFLRF